MTSGISAITRARWLMLLGLGAMPAFCGCPPGTGPTAQPPATADSVGTGAPTPGGTVQPTATPNPVGTVTPTPGGTVQHEPAPSPAPGALTLLNEIGILAGGANPPFVELKVGSGGPPLSELKLRLDGGPEYALPDNVVQPAARTIVLIIFDDVDSTEGTTIHATLPDLGNQPAGELLLLDESGATLDRASWGATVVGGIRLGRGGAIGEPQPGMSVGRLAQAVNVTNAEWISFSPDQASPGQPNPNPAVEILRPGDGAVLPAGEVRFSWYPVVGATRYRIQVAAGAPDFDPPLTLDQTVAAAPVSATLAAGVSFWRVQAMFADDTKASKTRMRRDTNLPRPGQCRLTPSGLRVSVAACPQNPQAGSTEHLAETRIS